MLSRRMHTASLSGRLFGLGGVCLGGVCLGGVFQEGVFQGSVCLGVVCHTPMDRQMPVKILPCPKLRLRVVISQTLNGMGSNGKASQYPKQTEIKCPLCLFAIRNFHKHTKLAIMALMPTLYSHIFALFFTIWA